MQVTLDRPAVRGAEPFELDRHARDARSLRLVGTRRDRPHHTTDDVDRLIEGLALVGGIFG